MADTKTALRWETVPVTTLQALGVADHYAAIQTARDTFEAAFGAALTAQGLVPQGKVPTFSYKWGVSLAFKDAPALDPSAGPTLSSMMAAKAQSAAAPSKPQGKSK